jgi:hypothetical protein
MIKKNSHWKRIWIFLVKNSFQRSSLTLRIKSLITYHLSLIIVIVKLFVIVVLLLEACSMWVNIFQLSSGLGETTPRNQHRWFYCRYHDSLCWNMGQSQAQFIIHQSQAHFSSKRKGNKFYLTAFFPILFFFLIYNEISNIWNIVPVNLVHLVRISYYICRSRSLNPRHSTYLPLT